MPQALLWEAKCQKLHVMQNIKKYHLDLKVQNLPPDINRGLLLRNIFGGLTLQQATRVQKLLWRHAIFQGFHISELNMFLYVWLFVGNVNLLEV